MGMRGLQRASGLKSKGAVRVCEVEPSMRSLLAALLLLRRRPYRRATGSPRLR